MSLPDGRIILAFNDDPQKRTKLTLAASLDGGQAWQRLLVLEDDPNGCFSYPTLHYLPEKVCCLLLEVLLQGLTFLLTMYW